MSDFLSENFQFSVVKFSIYLNRRVFIMPSQVCVCVCVCVCDITLHNFSVNKFSTICIYITKTCLYNVDPLKSHFCIVKLGFTGVYISFLISAQKHRFGYSLELPR